MTAREEKARRHLDRTRAYMKDLRSRRARLTNLAAARLILRVLRRRGPLSTRHLLAAVLMPAAVVHPAAELLRRAGLIRIDLGEPRSGRVPTIYTAVYAGARKCPT